jgi:hypothetical protein
MTKKEKVESVFFGVDHRFGHSEMPDRKMPENSVSYFSVRHFSVRWPK